MPRRGYRKGITDQKEPLTRAIYTRVTEDAYERLSAEAKSRSFTISRLVRTLLNGHTREERAELPRLRGMTAEYLREFTRTGNNLNQLARQANKGLVPVDEAKLDAVLVQLMDLAMRLL